MSPHLSVSPNPRVPFEVVYEDDDLLALSKPAGVVTQPGDKHLYDSLLNGAFSRWGKRLQNLGKKRDFGLLHRLDRGTSGLVLIALSVECYDGLRASFERRAISKKYWAMVSGRPHPVQGRCELRIVEVRSRGQKRAQVIMPTHHQAHVRRDQHERRSRRPTRAHRSRDDRVDHRHRRNQQKSEGYTQRGQRAITSYQTLDTSTYGTESAALLACELHTGRLHQIRAHMSALGTPIIGDFDYGGKTPLNLLARQQGRGQLALHAGNLGFTHPCSGAYVQLQAPVSTWFQRLAVELDLSLPETLIGR